jgi:hypothetical protein
VKFCDLEWLMLIDWCDLIDMIWLMDIIFLLLSLLFIGGYLEFRNHSNWNGRDKTSLLEHSSHESIYYSLSFIPFSDSDAHILSLSLSHAHIHSLSFSIVTKMFEIVRFYDS